MPFNLAWIHLLKSSCIESRTMRMLFTMSCVLLAAAAALLSVSGCAEESSNGPESLEDSLAKLEKARTEALWSKPGDKASQSGPGTSDVPQSGSFVVKVESSAGDYKIEVHRDWAPIGAERFYQLVNKMQAEYIYFINKIIYQMNKQSIVLVNQNFFYFF